VTFVGDIHYDSKLNNGIILTRICGLSDIEYRVASARLLFFFFFSAWPVRFTFALGWLISGRIGRLGLLAEYARAAYS
jgi:hypothetical protein